MSFPKADVRAIPETTSTPSYFGYLSGVASTLWNSGYWLSDISAQIAGTASGTADGVEKPSAKIIVHKVSRSEIVKKTQSLVSSFIEAETTKVKLLRVDELNRHLMSFPASRLVAVQVRYILISWY